MLPEAEGATTIFLDNINHKVDSGDLAAALTAGTWKGSYFDDERKIVVIHDDIHSGKPDHFVQAVPSFVDGAEAGHQHPDFHSLRLYVFRELSQGFRWRDLV